MRTWQKKPSLKELSSRLELSMTTVSRALNGYEDVSQRTRERVIEAAKVMGYTPNVLARRLTTGNSEAVGFVMSNVDDYFGDPYFAELLAGITEVLNRADKDLVIACAASPEEQLAKYRRLVQGRRVDGLVLDRTRTKDPRVDYLLERKFPFVAFGQTGRSSEHAYLDFDGHKAFYETACRLIRLGHRKIAMIGADSRYNFVKMRRQGYEAALIDAGIQLDPRYYGASGFGQAAGATGTHKLLDLPDPPTAIMCIDDLNALGAMAALRDRGLSAGVDVSITGYNNVASAKLCDPPLTTVSMPARKAGNRLAGMLIELLRGKSVEELQEIWVPTLVPRQSDGPPPK